MWIDNLLPDLEERRQPGEDQYFSLNGKASAREVLRTAVLLDGLGIIDVDRLANDVAKSKPKLLGFSILMTAH